MTGPKVLKPFNTRAQRFSEGDTVSILDDLSPHTFSDLAAQGFIDAPKVAEPKAAPPSRFAASRKDK